MDTDSNMIWTMRMIEIFERAVKVHLDDIASNSYEFICDSMDISLIIKNIHRLLHLSPIQPWRIREHVSICSTIFRVEISVEDSLINLEKERIALTLNPEMIAKLEKEQSSDLKKKFLKQSVAEHFNKRQDLIKHCGELLIKKQRLFFLEGDKFILPCLQKDMAAELGVSSSTISRLVRSKYIECKHGVFLIKNLCQRSIWKNSYTGSRIGSLLL